MSWGREEIVGCYLDYTDNNALYNAYLGSVNTEEKINEEASIEQKIFNII